MLGLIFSLMHQSSLSQHPVSEGILFSPLQLNFISRLLFLLKTLSEWERLNSDNPQLSTRLSIHSFINLLPVSSFLYIKRPPSLARRRYAQFHGFQTRHTNVCCFFFFSTYVLLLVCFSPCSLVLYPPVHTSTLPDSAAICLVIHPSLNTFPT